MTINRLIFRTLLLLVVFSTVFLQSCFKEHGLKNSYDVVVYGGTSAGVIAAIQATKLGKQAVIIEPGKHLGGLTSGGLGATDIGNKDAIGGLSREFYKSVNQYYNPNSDSNASMWTFEPHVAENIFMEWIEEAGVLVIYNERLNLINGVKKTGSRIEEIIMESGLTIKGKMFIDATYEGDLMANSGVNFTVGREANKTYGEKYNGVQIENAKNHQFKNPVDPYLIPGKSVSGVLPGILNDGGPGVEGEGDHRIQAYCFRMCMTNIPENRIPFPKPLNYDPLRYELLLRYINTGVFDVLNLSTPMPNGKTDTNNKGAFATDNIGMNYEYPNGDYSTRENIIKEHENYQKGLMWFLANDPRVPSAVRDEVKQWGLPKDEFTDNGNWSHQLYIREARRMISDYVMTQHDCEGLVATIEPVGLAAYTMDSHNVQRYVDSSGKVKNEGNVEVGGFPPYPISYRSIVPKREECSNLLVPVCLSASHIAFGSIRMEPVFMVLAQSSATAAVQAINEEVDIQEINYKKLKDHLLKDGQVLQYQQEPILTGIKEIELLNEKSKDVSVRSVELKDVAIMSYPGNFMEYDSKGGSISYVFNVDEYFDYKLIIHKMMNSTFGSAKVWIDDIFIGDLNCTGDFDITVPAEQEFYLPLLSKGEHSFTLEFNKEAKIGIGEIALIKIPIKIKEILISQSFPGFIGERGVNSYSLENDRIIWKKVEVSENGIVELDALLEPKKNCHAFAITELICDKDIRTNLRFGHNDGAIIWLNGEIIYEYTDVNSFKYNEFALPIDLKKGKNELVMMIMQAEGKWLFNLNLDSYQFENRTPGF